MSRLSVALLSVALVGCFSEPGRPSTTRDGGEDDDGGTGSDAGSDGPGPDAYTGPFQVRVVSTANSYEEFGSGTFRGTPGMTRTGWKVDATDVQAGELLVLIGNVDNGFANFYDDPVFADWSPHTVYVHDPDGQTMIVATKFAQVDDPTAYAGAYNIGGSPMHNTSASAAMALLAVDGADPNVAIAASYANNGTDQVLTVAGDAPSVSTTVPGSLLIYGLGVDWKYARAHATFVQPTGWDLPVAITDEHSVHPTTGDYNWTTLMIATKLRATTGATGIIEGSTTSDGMEDGDPEHGVPLVTMLAIAPKQ